MNKNVTVKKHKQIIPTYVPRKPLELPMFFERKPYQGASGRLYPVPYADGITDIKEDIDYEVYTLENEYIKTQVLPCFGGKILNAYDKIGDYDFVYHNKVVKPALVGLGGPWISGGIEFNWPQHHRPTTYMPLEATIEENSDGGKTVWTGEVDPFYRMKGMAGITIDSGRSYIRAKVRIYNRTSLVQRFMWWANLAVAANDSYRTIFPPDVEWVNDHDRRATMSWPIAKGIYHTARPFDYGEGTDLSKYSAVKVPSSFMVSQDHSHMDFVAGYDGHKGMGIVTVADHHISPGKKMWHWGLGEFGDMWCSNLTDEDGPYIEIMTGVYTDNQPDFTWIAPFETKEFEQYWYPIREIGDVKNASIDAAMNMEQQGDDLFFGFNVTGTFENCIVLAKTDDTTLYAETTSLSPEKAYLKKIGLNGCSFNDITVSLVSADGKTLVEYTPYIRGQKQPTPTRKPVVRPQEIKTIEELYINGYHLEQYKQHNYDAKDYYMEALQRDSGDIRCNTAMGRLSLNNGEFHKCVDYCNIAIERLTMRNQHPNDTEAFYLKGIALCYLEKEKEAYDVLFKAAWNYGYRSPAYYKLGTLDCRNQNYTAALEKLDISLGLNYGHTKAKNLKIAILRHLGQKSEAKAMAKASTEDDLLDLWAMFELNHFTDNTEYILETFGQKPENFIDIVCDYVEAGFYEDALYVLNFAGDNYPMFGYYRAYCLHKLGKEGLTFIEAAEKLDSGYCFPSRLEDILVLNHAIKHNPKGANAYYYLGCLFYDRFRYEEAIAYWEACVARDNTNAKAFRNLSLGYFDKRGDFASARICLKKSLEINPNEPRLLLEYQQLLKNSNASIDERLDIYKKYSVLMAKRDDCYLDYIILLCMKGEYKNAIRLAKERHFHIYEGGEGKLTNHHGWMHVLYGLETLQSGNMKEAEKILLGATILPESYGEAKTFFNQEAHIYYFLGLLMENEGRDKEAVEAYKEASVYKAAVSELSLFRALALRKLMEFSEAKKVLDEMIASGNNLIINKDLRTYFGVGSPSPMPFEYNIEKINCTNGYILKAYALLGLGKNKEALTYIDKAAALDPNDFRIYAFRNVYDSI